MTLVNALPEATTMAIIAFVLGLAVCAVVFVILLLAQGVRRLIEKARRRAVSKADQLN